MGDGERGRGGEEVCESCVVCMIGIEVAGWSMGLSLSTSQRLIWDGCNLWT